MRKTPSRSPKIALGRKNIPKPRVATPDIKKRLKTKKVKRRNLVKELDAIFSRYIRKKDADKDGNVACYTCARVFPWEKLQCGHYITRAARVTRWDVNNCRTQCYGCNVGQGGRFIDFREHLVRDMGEQEVRNLELRRNTILKLNDVSMKVFIEHYQQLFDRL